MRRHKSYGRRRKTAGEGLAASQAISYKGGRAGSDLKVAAGGHEAASHNKAPRVQSSHNARWPDR